MVTTGERHGKRYCWLEVMWFSFLACDIMIILNTLSTIYSNPEIQSGPLYSNVVSSGSNDHARESSIMNIDSMTPFQVL